MVSMTNQAYGRWRTGAIGLAILIVMLLALLPTSKTQAHSLDMYSQAQTIQFNKNGLQVDWKITPGPLLAESAWGHSSQNQNGQTSQTWLEPFFSQYTVSLDGQQVTDVQIQEIHWPASPDLLQSGEDPIEIQMVFKWPEQLTGQYQVSIHNANQEAISLNSI